jgi:murein L,D-transpeptidase YcbB/YkuD
METAMKIKHGMRCATAVALALALSISYAADDAKTSQPLTGKQKATAIGAGTGAVAGAVVGGPVGAVVGAGVGGYVGHEGTDANGKVSAAPTTDGTVRSAQAALNAQGFDAGAVDGQFGPNTQSAVRRFQVERGLPQSGTLDGATLSALGVNG